MDDYLTLNLFSRINDLDSLIAKRVVFKLESDLTHENLTNTQFGEYIKLLFWSGYILDGDYMKYGY